jgi:hypothetical protein
MTGGSNDWHVTNNPMNVIATNIDWQGEVTPAGSKWEWYKTMAGGIRAGTLSILAKWKAGKHTVYEITAAYAPPSENDTMNYAIFVAKWVGVGVRDYIDLRNPQVLLRYVLAVLAIENGVFVCKNISLATVIDGVNAALQYCGFPTFN